MPRPPSDISTRIVHAARSRFLNEGVDGASLRAIAKEAGTNIGMIYYYFPTKDDLFLAVVEEVYGHLLDDLTKAFANDATPEIRIQRAYERMAALAPEEFDVLRLVIREALVSSTRLTRIAERFTRGHLPLVFGTMLEGASTGRFASDVPPTALMAAAMCLGFLPPIVRRLIVDAGLPIAATLPPADDVARLMHRLLMGGISGPAAQNHTDDAPSR